MPHHFVRFSGNPITPEVAASRIYRFFIEVKLGLDVELAEELANSDPELKDILETVKSTAQRSSIRYGGAV